MNKKYALHLCLALGLSQLAIGCSDVDRASKPVEKSEVLSAEIQPPYEAGIVETPSPSVEIAPISRSADGHVHGGAKLFVVSEKGAIQMEFETPLYNLIGFEYAPQTDEEKARILDVEKRLSQPETLFSFNSEAKCTFETLDGKVALFPKKTEHLTDHQGHEKHDNDHHDEHNHDKTHADIKLNYAATCGNLDKLQTIKVLFFKDFQNMTDVELVYLGPSQQIGAELSPSKPTADLLR